jgi:hypothetical protein
MEFHDEYGFLCIHQLHKYKPYDADFYDWCGMLFMGGEL